MVCRVSTTLSNETKGDIHGPIRKEWRAALTLKVMGCHVKYAKLNDFPTTDSPVENRRYFFDQSDAIALRHRLLDVLNSKKEELCDVDSNKGFSLIKDDDKVSYIGLIDGKGQEKFRI